MMNTDKEQQSLFGKLDSVLVGVGNAVSWLIAVLIITISIQVVLRYLFKQSYTALEEIQWHFFAVIVMIGVVYSFAKDSHIRLDILHSKFSTKNKEIVEIIGIIFMLWPMIYVFFIHSLSFVAESFRVGERSMAPMGLGYRWAIKSIIPFAFSLLFLGSLSRLKKAIGLVIKRNTANGS